MCFCDITADYCGFSLSFIGITIGLNKKRQFCVGFKWGLLFSDTCIIMSITLRRQFLMRNPFTLYEQEVMSALYKSLNYCEENDLPTYEITKALSSIEDRLQVKEVV